MQLTQSLHRAATASPRATALLLEQGPRTWLQLRDRVARFAGALRGLGAGPGERVAILALNSAAYFEYFLAVPWAGAVTVPINTRWSLDEIVYALEDSGATLLLVDRNFVQWVTALRAQVPGLRHAVYLDADAPPAGLLGYEALIAQNAPRDDADCSGDDLAGIFYTGGTTGFPKGVMLSHQGLSICALAILADCGMTAGSVYLHVPPMFHLADMVGSLPALLAGARHAFVPSFSAEPVCRAIEQHRITHIMLVPTMIRMLLDSPQLANYDLSSLQMIIYAGSSISEQTLFDAFAQLPHTKFLQFYGQTELAPLATALRPEHHVLGEQHRQRLRSAGRPCVCVDLKIVDAELREVPSGSVGQIRVRGPNVMLGYWNKPAETRAALTDGWVLTGDLGYMDEDGFVYIVDRVKDMIVSGGENVYSIEVENALSSHPAVKTAVVIGIPDAKWGEAVHAVVQLRAGSACTADELIAHCRTHIARYKCPRSIEFRNEPFPASGAGKILKAELRKPYWQNQSRTVA